jgi:hypothetical protein
MGLKKGMNNFKSKQQETIFENTKKIEQSINEFPKEMEKPSLSKVIAFVSEKTGLHITTIKKNEDYLRMCEDVYLNLMKVKSNGNHKEIVELKKSIRTLELENSNLKNQIISLSNVIKRLEMSENINTNSDSNYKQEFYALLEHFKDQLQIVNDEVVDPYGGVRPKLICKLPKNVLDKK